ncbi:MAG: hypothetical protein RL681_828 [Candidatus Parcubacteria bacterium]
MIRDRLSVVLLLVAVLADVLLWQRVFAGGTEPALFALDIGQGDSILSVFPDGMTILTDAGPDSSVVRQLERVLPAGDRRIDIAVITHPQSDHFGGFADVLRRFSVGALLVSGRVADDAAAGSAWSELVDLAHERNVSLVRVGAGDRIRQGGYGADILGPDAAWLQSGELNDTGIVELLHFKEWRALLTADIGGSAENDLISRADVRADVLKVGHHGSRFSTSDAFLNAVAPRVALISVGARNRYGHPAEETLKRLAAAGAQVFRTDQDGAVRVDFRDGKLLITTQR